MPLLTDRQLIHRTTYDTIYSIMQEGRRLYGRAFFLALRSSFMNQICRSISGTCLFSAGVLIVICYILRPESRTSK